MIRRGNRTPSFIFVGLVLVVFILAFNYWTLSSQNADLQQEVEKLQAEVKISAVKMDQSDKKNAALHETIHEMDALSEKQKKKILQEDESLKTAEKNNKIKEYEITTLKNEILKLQEQIVTLNQQIEDKDADLAKAKETNTHLVTERDDAVEAIAEKDALINTLKRSVEQITVKRSQLTVSLAACNSEYAALRKHSDDMKRVNDDIAEIIVQTKQDAALEYESQLAVAKEQLVEEKSRSNTLQYSVDDLKKKLTQTFGDLSECQDKVTDLESSIKDHEIENLKEKSRIGILENTVDDLNKKLSQTMASATKCQREVSDLKLSAAAHEAEHQQAKEEVAAARREKMAIAKPRIEPGRMNIPNVENKELQNEESKGEGVGVLAAPQSEVQMNVAPINADAQLPAGGWYVGPPVLRALPPPAHGSSAATQSHALAHQHIVLPPAPAVMERPAPPVANNNLPIQPPVHPMVVNAQAPVNDVLAPPPQRFDDNLDAAIDEEEKVVEDLMDDQDEEGNEIKPNNENLNLDENNGPENKKRPRNNIAGIGALEDPRPFPADDVNHEGINVEEELGIQANYYEGNLDNNIRNLRRPPDLH